MMIITIIVMVVIIMMIILITSIMIIHVINMIIVMMMMSANKNTPKSSRQYIWFLLFLFVFVVVVVADVIIIIHVQCLTEVERKFYDYQVSYHQQNNPIEKSINLRITGSFSCDLPSFLKTVSSSTCHQTHNERYWQTLHELSLYESINTLSSGFA